MRVRGDRFEPSRHVPATTAPGCGIEGETADRADFAGSVSVLSLGGATLIEIRAAPCLARPGERSMPCGFTDALRIYQRRSGGAWRGTGDSEFVVSSGSLATPYSDLPFVTQPTLDAGLHLRIVEIPVACCGSSIRHERDLVEHPLAIEPGMTALFASYFESFVEQAPHLTGAAAEAAVHVLAQLALVACGSAEPCGQRDRHAGRIGLLQKARQTVENNIHRSDLSPATLASLLGISVRRLHLLFEPTGTTCTRYVLSRRLEHARLLLVRSSKRPVADVAYACGFDSLSTFYRSFRAAFGMSPADFRESAK